MYFLIKFIHFTLKIYSFGPKIAFKAFCTTKDAKSFVKINFLVTKNFLLKTQKFCTTKDAKTITRQNFENNLRILANIEEFSRKNLKIYGFRQYVLKNYSFFFVFSNKDYTFYTKNLFIRPKNCV